MTEPRPGCLSQPHSPSLGLCRYCTVLSVAVLLVGVESYGYKLSWFWEHRPLSCPSYGSLVFTVTTHSMLPGNLVNMLPAGSCLLRFWLPEFGCSNTLTNSLVMPKHSHSKEGLWPWTSWGWREDALLVYSRCLTQDEQK